MKVVSADWIPRRTHRFVCSLEGRGGEVAVVEVAGELRTAAAPELGRTMRRAERQARLVVLDLRRLAFIDPCGAPVEPRFASKAVDVVELQPSQPAVQALLVLAREERAAGPAPLRASGP